MEHLLGYYLRKGYRLSVNYQHDMIVFHNPKKNMFFTLNGPTKKEMDFVEIFG